MVFKRFIKKNGKLMGPYYYESYRDETGKVKKRYLGTSLPTTNHNPIKGIVTPQLWSNDRKKLFLGVATILVFLAIFVVLFVLYYYHINWT